MKRFLCTIGLLIAATSLSAETRSITLLQYGRVDLEVPPGWETSINQSGDEAGPSFQFRPPRHVPLVLLVTAIPHSGSPEDLAQSVQRSAEGVLASMREIAIEEELSIQELRGPHSRLLYVSATDKTVMKPSDVDFVYGDQGAVEVGRIMLTFTILTNEKDAPERLEAFEIVKSARHFLPDEK